MDVQGNFEEFHFVLVAFVDQSPHPVVTLIINFG
jgi:hypothetical protein